MGKLTDSQIAILTRLVGHHTTGDPFFDIYNALYEICHVRGIDGYTGLIDTTEPLPLVAIVNQHYGNRPMVKIEESN